MAGPIDSLKTLSRLFRREKLAEPMGFDQKQGAGGLDLMAAWYQSRVLLSPNRLKRYKDYRDMGEDPMIAGALDLYADDSTQPDPFRKASIWPQSKNRKVVDEIRRMLDEIEIDDNLWRNARYTAQFGDNFVRPLINKDHGIVGLELMEAEQVERQVDKFGRLTGFKVSFMGDVDFKPWEFVHFRVIGSSHPLNEGGTVYGTSLLEAARRPYRQLRMLEDCIVIYRLEIGGRHRIFYVDVSGLSFAQGITETKKIQDSFGKREYFNPDTKEFMSKFEPLYLSNDLFWPVRKDSASRVDYLGTDPNVTGVADLEFIRYNLHAALKAPRAFLGGDEYQSAKYGLSQIYIVFSRLTKRLQRSQINGYTRMAQIHLALRDIDPLAKQNQFKMMMMQPSSLDQEQRLEALELATELAVKVKEAGDLIGIDPQRVKQHAEMIFLGLTPYDLAMLGQNPDDEEQSGGDLTEAMLHALQDDPGLAGMVRAFQLKYGVDQEPDRFIGERVGLADGVENFPGKAAVAESLREQYEEWYRDEQARAAAGQSRHIIEIDDDVLEHITPYLRRARASGGHAEFLSRDGNDAAPGEQVLSLQ